MAVTFGRYTIDGGYHSIFSLHAKLGVTTEHAPDARVMSHPLMPESFRLRGADPGSRKRLLQWTRQLVAALDAQAARVKIERAIVPAAASAGYDPVAAAIDRDRAQREASARAPAVAALLAEAQVESAEAEHRRRRHESARKEREARERKAREEAAARAAEAAARMREAAERAADERADALDVGAMSAAGLARLAERVAAERARREAAVAPAAAS